MGQGTVVIIVIIVIIVVPVKQDIAVPQEGCFVECRHTLGRPPVDPRLLRLFPGAELFGRTSDAELVAGGNSRRIPLGAGGNEHQQSHYCLPDVPVSF